MADPGVNQLQLGLPPGDESLSARVAEVVSASITGYTAECLPLVPEEPWVTFRPSFGSILRVDCQDEELSIYGVVYNILTGSPDSFHRPAALGLTREQLQLQQPHIFSLLRTEMHAAIIAHKRNSTVYRFLPPRPPLVHDFVYRVEPQEVLTLTEDFEFLRLLTNISEVPQDELIAATIREACALIEGDRAFLIEAGRTLSSIFRDDYDRLLSILRKLRPEGIDR